MFRRRFLPWEYGVRNLLRRPTRTVLTLAALSTVVLLVFVVVGFIRGLEKSLAESGDADVVLVYSLGAEENIENSSIAARTPALLTASLDGVQRRFGIQHVSPDFIWGRACKPMRTRLPVWDWSVASPSRPLWFGRGCG